MIFFTEVFNEAWDSCEKLYEESSIKKAIISPQEIINKPDIINQLKNQPYKDDNDNEISVEYSWQNLGAPPHSDWIGRSGIYCIRHKETFQRYYGLSVNLASRITQHSKAAIGDKDSAFHQVVSGNVSDFEVAVVKYIDIGITLPEYSEKALTQDSLRQLYWVKALIQAEKDFIKHNDTYQNEYHFNQTSGGELGNYFVTYTNYLRALYLIVTLVNSSSKSTNAKAKSVKNTVCQITDKTLKKYDNIFILDPKLNADASESTKALFINAINKLDELSDEDILNLISTDKEFFNDDVASVKNIISVVKTLAKEQEQPSAISDYYKNLNNKKQTLNNFGLTKISRIDTPYYLRLNNYEGLNTFIADVSTRDNNIELWQAKGTNLVANDSSELQIPKASCYVFSSAELADLAKGITVLDYFKNIKSDTINDKHIPRYSMSHLLVLFRAAHLQNNTSSEDINILNTSLKIDDNNQLKYINYNSNNKAMSKQPQKTIQSSKIISENPELDYTLKLTDDFFEKLLFVINTTNRRTYNQLQTSLGIFKKL